MSIGLGIIISPKHFDEILLFAKNLNIFLKRIIIYVIRQDLEALKVYLTRNYLGLA